MITHDHTIEYMIKLAMYKLTCTGELMWAQRNMGSSNQ